VNFITPDSWGTPLTEKAKGYDEDSRFTHKAQRCHQHVEGQVANKYAVCNKSIGKHGAYKKYGGK
jgi:hypothetical protein